MRALRLEEGPVLGLHEDLDLGVVGSHVALAAGLWLPRQRDRGGVSRVTLGAGPEGAVGVGLPDVVAAVAPQGDGGRPL